MCAVVRGRRHARRGAGKAVAQGNGRVYGGVGKRRACGGSGRPVLPSVSPRLGVHSVARASRGYCPVTRSGLAQ